MSATVYCRVCGCPLLMDGSEHQWHDIRRCNRFLNGFCDCDGWSCAACCRECAPTPRALRLAALNKQPQVPVASTRGLVKRRSAG